MYALGGVARGGATRGGYVSGLIFVLAGGVHVGHGRAPGTPGVVIESLAITDSLDDTPNRCRYRQRGAVPANGTEIVLTLGSKNNLERMFAGHLLSVNQIYAADNPKFVQADVAAVDYTWIFGFRKITKRYFNQSATAIALDMIATAAAEAGFTGNDIAAGLPLVDEITFTNEDLPDAMSRLARRIGAYWYVDYLKGVHLFVSEERNGAPVPLTYAHKSLAHFTAIKDRSQTATRIYVEGRGSRLLSAVLVGDSMIPIVSADMFVVAADVFVKVSPQGSEGGAQHLNFSGVELGGVGSLVGPGAGPPGPPSAVGALGAGLSAGVYKYAYTFVTPTGETLPSSLAAMIVGGPIPPPTAAPSPINPSSGVGVDSGTHWWTYTFVDAHGGETPGAPGASASTIGSVSPPTSAPTQDGLSEFQASGLSIGSTYRYVATWIGNGGGETTGGPVLVQSTVGLNGPYCWINLGPPPSPPGAAGVKFYRTKANQTGPFYFVQHDANWWDSTPDSVLGTHDILPTVNTAVALLGVVAVYGIAPGPGSTVARRVYRTRLSDNSIRLVATINDNTTTYYIDSKSDANLGALLPTINTTVDDSRRVQLTNIAAGPTAAPAVTSRKIYRTVVDGAQLKLVATLGDNSTTAYLDSTADAGLGANAPIGDTSGIVQPAGQVPAGSASVIVANPAAFLAGGGWAVIGNGELVIRYTGKAGNLLTGIPPTGVGAIVAAVAYNSTITAAPMLTGIPAAGARAIVSQLTEGDEIYSVVQCDDAGRQAALAASMGVLAGIREDWVQDRRLSIAEARARGVATLALHPLDESAVSYTCRDLRTASGKTIHVDLAAPTNVTGDFKIQEVEISNFRPHANQYPTFVVKASSRLFTFDDLLRRMQTTE